MITRVRVAIAMASLEIILININCLKTQRVSAEADYASSVRSTLTKSSVMVSASPKVRRGGGA